MYGLNKVYLVGFLGSDPEANKSKNGKDYVRLNLATHRSTKTADGQWEAVTDWHNVTVWGKRAESCAQNLRKGAKVMVDGYLSHYESTDEKGETRRQTAITANNVEFFNAAQLRTRASA